VARGGPRTPTNPAPVSGPGALSQRTDGGPGKQPLRTPTGLPYGEGQALTELQRGAPLAASPGGGTPVPAGATGPALPVANVTPFNAPTQQPATPVTAGAAAGPGPGPEALNLPNQPSQDMQRLMAYLPVLEFMANQPGASAAARNVVRDLKGRQ
jgi:hypothetical protein